MALVDSSRVVLTLKMFHEDIITTTPAATTDFSDELNAVNTLASTTHDLAATILTNDATAVARGWGERTAGAVPGMIGASLSATVEGPGTLGR